MQSNGFDPGKGRQGYFAERQMATVRLRVRIMSELGSIRVIILVYTGQTDLKQIVLQNNKMILFLFSWISETLQYRECLQCSGSNNINSRTRLLK